MPPARAAHCRPVWRAARIGRDPRRFRSGLKNLCQEQDPRLRRCRHPLVPFRFQTVKSIGRLGSPWTPELARKKALELLGTLVGGDDPFAQPLASEGFGAEVNRYLEWKRPSLKPRWYVETARYLRKSAAPLHRMRLADVDRRSIALVLAE